MTGTATQRTPAERKTFARMDAAAIASARAFWIANAPASRVGLIDALVVRSAGAAIHAPEQTQARARSTARIGVASPSWGIVRPYAATGGASRSGWRFLPGQRLFERAANGAKLAAEKVRKAVDFVAGAAQKTAARLGKLLSRGKIDLPEWQDKMETLIKDAHGAGGLIGAGGIENATEQDLEKMEAAIAYQLKYLEDFATDIENGLPLDGRIPQRAAQYAGAAIPTYENVNRIGHQRSGFPWERRYINSSIPCPECSGYADAGWQATGTLPDLGQECTCQTHCRCSFMYRTTDPYAGKSPPSFVLGPVPPKPTKPLPFTDPNSPARVNHVIQVKAKQDAAYLAMAAQHGTTPEQIKTTVNDGFKAAVKAGEFYVRVDLSTLPKILSAGRIKSQFETGASDASYNPAVRADVESRLFGTIPTVKPKQRPVYGYVSRPDFASANAPADARVSGYGNVVVRMKPDVRNRASVTASDSLGLNGQMVGVAASAPTADAVPVASRGFQRTYADTLKDTTDGGQWLDAIGVRLGYLEAQFHGGIKVRDIADVGLSSPPSPALKAALDAAGVPWRVLP